MKILLVSEWFPPDLGGIARQTQELAKALDRAGHDVSVAALSLDARNHETVEEGVHLYRFAAWYSPVRGDFFRLAYFPRWRMKRVLQALRPDVVHVQSSQNLGLAAVVLCRQMGIPLVITHHHFIYDAKGAWWSVFDKAFWLYSSWLYKHTHFITAPTPAAATFLARQGIAGVRALSNGLNMQHFGHRTHTKEQARVQLQMPVNKKILLYVGRHSPEKRMQDALEAVHQLQRQDVLLAIVGDGPVHSQMVDKVAAWHDPRIVFYGRVDDQTLPIYYQAADAFLFPSPVESQCLSMLEALTFGLPIIGSTEGAVGAFIQQGETGYLFSPNNCVQASQAIEAVFALSEEEKRVMAKKGMNLVRQLNFETLIDQYVQLYQEAMKAAHHA